MFIKYKDQYFNLDHVTKIEKCPHLIIHGFERDYYDVDIITVGNEQRISFDSQEELDVFVEKLEKLLNHNSFNLSPT